MSSSTNIDHRICNQQMLLNSLGTTLSSPNILNKGPKLDSFDSSSSVVAREFQHECRSPDMQPAELAQPPRHNSFFPQFPQERAKVKLILQAQSLLANSSANVDHRICNQQMLLNSLVTTLCPGVEENHSKGWDMGYMGPACSRNKTGSHYQSMPLRNQ